MEPIVQSKDSNNKESPYFQRIIYIIIRYKTSKH